MDAEDIKTMEVSELVFDLKNPRLVEFDLTGSPSKEKVIQLLWEAMNVREVLLSIAASGFFPHEPLIVAEEDGQNVVIEGNRRLAAVNILLDPEKFGSFAKNLPPITVEAKNALAEVPVVVGSREKTWRYLGFKHVNGPAKWSSYAKSQYIADVHKDFGISLEDIAMQIGDTHKTVQRLYRGLMVIEQAERKRVFDREDRWFRSFYFSHLYTGIGYTGISDFIGLRPETDEQREPVPDEKIKELGELCLWMYGSARENIPPVIQKQNPHLRWLERVVSNREALGALRDDNNLETAFEISRPSSNVFEESLLAAKRHLEKARALLSTGYEESDQLLGFADDVADLAYDLYEEMQRKSRRRSRDKRMEERG